MRHPKTVQNPKAPGRKISLPSAEQQRIHTTARKLQIKI